MLRPSKLGLLASGGLLVLVILLAWLFRFPSAQRRSKGDDANDAVLSSAAQQAVEQGKAAASQKPPAWAVAVSYFDAARKAAPLSPEPLYFLGLAEAQMHGRELRAICWFEAYLALAPNSDKSAQVRTWIRELEVKARSNTDNIEQRLEKLADVMDFEYYRKAEQSDLYKLRLPSPAVAPSSPRSSFRFSQPFARWQAERWIVLADQRMNIPEFLDFDRALGNASEGHPLDGRYPRDREERDAERMRYSSDKMASNGGWANVPNSATPAQFQLNENFYSILAVGVDLVAAFLDILATREVLQGLEREINKSNVRLILGPWRCAADFSENLAAVSDSPYCDDGWGFIDKSGTFVIPPNLRVTGGLFGPDVLGPDVSHFIPAFSEGFASLGYAFIDKSGAVKIRGRWTLARNFHGGLAAALYDGGKWGFIRPSGDAAIAPAWDNVRDFSEGFAAVEKGGKWGLIDKSGNVVLKPIWKRPLEFHEGLAAYIVGDKAGFLGALCTPRDAILDEVELRDSQIHGCVAVLATWDDAHPFSEGLAAIKRSGKWGFINKSGNVAIAPTWDDVNADFSGGLAMVYQNGQGRSIIDVSGKVVGTSLGELLPGRILKVHIYKPLAGHPVDASILVELAQ
ncbi:MAG TPA: WG repeat-containing protein [Candidatus Angelobacter sp.]